MNTMTVGNPTTLVLKFIIPLLIGNLFQQLYSMVDSIIVGNFLGTEALAGVGSTGSINFFVIGFSMGLTNGFGVPIAQSFGANNLDRVRHLVATSIILTVLSSIVITIVAVSGLMPILNIMGTPSDIVGYAHSYMSVLLSGMSAIMAYNLMASILRALGDSRTPLYFLVVSSILNIVLDLVFIVNLDMGVAGAGLATVISQGTSAILCMIYISRKFEILKMKKEDFKINPLTMGKLLGVGLPMAFQSSIIATGTMFVQSAVNSLGTVVVASYSIVNKIEQLAIQPFVTLGVGATTYTAQNLGAGNIDRIIEGMKKMTIIGLVLSISAGLILYAVRVPFISLFLAESDDITEVLSYATTYMVWECSFFIPLMLLILYRSSMQGMGDIIMPTLLGIVELTARVTVATLFTNSLGFFAICISCPFAWVGGALLIVPALLVKVKKLKKLNPSIS